MIRVLCAGLVLLLSLAQARSETYDQWVGEAPVHAPVTFRQWLPPQPIPSGYGENRHQAFESPPGHLFGYLDLSALPASGFPVRVRFLYDDIPLSSVNPLQDTHPSFPKKWTDSLDLLAADAPVPAPFETLNIPVKDAAAAKAIPVWSTSSPAQPNRYANNPAFSLRIEVVDHDGAILAREHLIEAVTMTTAPVVLARRGSGQEALLSSLGTPLTLTDQLPFEGRAYDDIKVLWLDADTLHDPLRTDDFWRKVFFAGTFVVGNAGEVQELAQRLGMPVNGRILQGGLWDTTFATAHLSDQFENSNGVATYLSMQNKENPFEPPFNPGKKIDVELRDFSIGFLLLFTIFETGIIIWSLYFLSGYRRVLRWLLIPLCSILYAAAGFAVVPLFVDFHPETFLVQEVDSVEGWPDSLIKTQINRLGFQDDRTFFAAPGAAEFAWRGLGTASPVSCEQQDGSTLFSLHQSYGKFMTATLRYWAKNDAPCHVTDKAGVIVATRPLLGAWVWDGTTWRNVGSMSPGIPVNLDLAPAEFDSGQTVAKGRLQLALNSLSFENTLPDIISQMISSHYTDTLKNTDTGLLLAVDARPVPGGMTDAQASEVHTQTILVHQFKLTPAKP